MLPFGCRRRSSLALIADSRSASMQKRENHSAPTLRADQSKYVRAREASEEGKSKAREKNF